MALEATQSFKDLPKPRTNSKSIVTSPLNARKKQAYQSAQTRKNSRFLTYQFLNSHATFLARGSHGSLMFPSVRTVKQLCRNKNVQPTTKRAKKTLKTQPSTDNCRTCNHCLWKDQCLYVSQLQGDLQLFISSCNLGHQLAGSAYAPSPVCHSLVSKGQWAECF